MFSIKTEKLQNRSRVFLFVSSSEKRSVFCGQRTGREFSFERDLKEACVIRRRILLVLLLMGISFLVTGCKTPVKLPEVVGEKPKLEELVKAVNENSGRIQSLRAERATFGTNNAVGWGTCMIVFQRPNRLRTVASVTMTGPVLDCGCNDDLFWYWSKYDNPPQLVWANKSELTDAASPADTIPIEPTWIASAIGIVEFNLNDISEGPLPQPDGSLLVVSKVQRPDGLYMKHHYILPKSAAVKRQEIYDPYGNQIVKISCEEFQVKKVQEQDVVLPKRLIITTPLHKDSFHLDFGELSLNGQGDITENLFVMPKPEDLGNPTVVNLKEIKRRPIQNPSPDSGYTQTRNTTVPSGSAISPDVNAHQTNTTSAASVQAAPVNNQMTANSTMTAAPVSGGVAYQAAVPVAAASPGSGEVSAHFRTQVLE